MKKPSLKFSLSFFLAAVLVIGSGIGMSVRYYRSLPHHYVQQTRSVEGYRVSGCWCVDGAGKDTLVWLVVFANGDGGVSGGGDGITSAHFVENSENPFKAKSVGLWNRGIFQNGKMFEHSDDGRIWLYYSTKLTVSEITVSEEDRSLVSYQTFQHLETTALWKGHLRPPAEWESALFQEKMGVDLKYPIPKGFKSKVRPG